MLKIELLKRKKQLEEYISRIEPWLKKKPDIKLKVSSRKQNGKTYYRYYLMKDGKQQSIREDTKLVELLAKKDYYSKVLLSAKKELKRLTSLLEVVDDIADIGRRTHEAKHKMIKPLEMPVDILVKSFLEEKYPPSEYEIKYPNETLKGDIVRSWPEALIANTLFENKIPYRYERPFTLFNGHMIRPDFTIMHPVSGELFIWEHLGMTDKESYKSIAMKKIKDYALSNVVIGKSLIVTFDNDEYKLTRKEVQQLIEAFFNES